MVTSDRVTVITDVVCAAIRAYRKREGVTREEFAAAAWEQGAPQSFTATVVGHLETGRRSAGGRRREITLDELVFVAATIGTTPLALLGEHAAAYGGDRAPECVRCAGRAGVLQAQVREDIEALGDLAGVDPSLAQAAYVLAEAVDAGADGGRMLPRLTKELRATLEQIVASAPADEPPDDDDDELGDLGAPE